MSLAGPALRCGPCCFLGQVEGSARGSTPPSFPPHQGEGGACLDVTVPSSPSPLWGGTKGGGIAAGWFEKLKRPRTLSGAFFYSIAERLSSNRRRLGGRRR